MVVYNRESMRVVTPTRIVLPDRKQLRVSLLEASRRALHYRRSIVVSLAQPIEHMDPIDVLDCLKRCEMGDCFFWAQPSVQAAFIGCGSVAQIETKGATRFTTATEAWHSLVNHAVVDGVQQGVQAHLPILLGGFSFDAQRPISPLWEGFSPGSLVLPQLLFLQDTGQAMLVMNALVRPGDDIEQHISRILAVLSKAQMALEGHSIHSWYEQEADLTVSDLRPVNEWMELVGRTARQIRAGVYEKVVLARSVRATLDAREHPTFSISQILSRLTWNYPGAYIFAIQRGERCFVGATPERLARVQDGQLYTVALAGTAPRGTSEMEDQAIGTALLHSGKDHEEHTIVVAMLQKALEQFCRHICIGDRQQLVKLRNVQHLMTHITGELLPGYSVMDIVADLHPTPAVGGLPRQSALLAIREQEELDRGWYAGPVGWVDAHGEGEFAVALRSGLIHGREATLFAGCGIVGNSDPQSEYMESCLKLRAMLYGLGETN